VRRDLALVNHALDYTLMPPTGGPTRLDVCGGGDGDLELDKRYVSDDLAVLVGVERQHGPVAGLPDQDWPLRVTLVFRREDSDRRLVHRHADALVHPISMEQLSLLARGAVEPGAERSLRRLSTLGDYRLFRYWTRSLFSCAVRPRLKQPS
jgi:hypothetical protein